MSDVTTDFQKTAVILLNMGGPNDCDAIKPFLYNMFCDSSIIDLPAFFRIPLAKLISSSRASDALEIYNKIGGGSPILEETQKQAQALESALQNNVHIKHRVFAAMRYWYPFAEETIEKVKRYAPEKIILLPLYPQFSTVTTASSIKNWQDKSKNAGLSVPTQIVYGYPRQESFIKAQVDLLRKIYNEALESSSNTPRILFSAHGLPEKIVEKGDPYPKQVEMTVKAIIDKFAVEGIDYRICYQSRVGPVKWIEPDTHDEVKKAAIEEKSIIVVPVSFVSEHSETLYELDILCKKIASDNGANNYYRVPTVGTHKFYIKALQELCNFNGETLY